jgi:hypothetical protein
VVLTRKQLEVVCLINDSSGRRCRYIAFDSNDRSKAICAKKSSKRADIDDEIDLVCRKMLADGKDPYKSGEPMGDNCPGFLVLLGKEQGLK